MDYRKHQEDILKEINLAGDSQKNKLGNELQKMFKDTIILLRKFAAFLSVTKGKDQQLIIGSDLAEISTDILHRNEYVLFNINEIYHRFMFKLSNFTEIHNQIDINKIILQLLSNCLLYLINLLREEDDNVGDIFKYFLDLKKCIFIFSGSPLILNTNKFKNLVSCWIVDLLKLITEADGNSKYYPKHLKIFNVIKQILSSLARCNVYCDLILREISKKFECVLTYHVQNDQFIDYITSKALAFEYLLWIMKTAVHDAAGRGFVLEEAHVSRIRQVLDGLTKCLDGKCPSAITSAIDDILRFF